MTRPTDSSELSPLPPEFAVADDGGGLFSRPYAAASATFLATMFLTGFAALAVVPTLPTAAEALDGVALFPLVAGCFVAAGMFGGVLGGHWADVSGARRPLAAGMVLTVLTLVVAASSTSIWQLAAGRFLEGLAAGMVAVSVNTAIGEAYPERLRPRALALMSAGWIVPSLAGPPLAGVVAETWSWRAVFYGLAALTLVPSLAMIVVLRRRAWSDDRPRETTARPALLVTLAVSVGAALGQYGVSGWNVRHAVLAGAGAVLLVALAPRLLPEGTWRSASGLPATVLLRGLSSGVFFTLEAFVPLMLITERKVDAVVIGLVFTSAAVVWAAGSWVQGRWLDGWPRHRLVCVGAGVQTAAVAVALAGTLPGVPALVGAAAMPLAAVGMGMMAPALTVLSLVHSGPGRQGQASGAMQTSQNLGQIAVLGLATAVLNVSQAFGAPQLASYGAAFGALLAPGVLPLVLGRRTRRRSEVLEVG
ncbi:MFS transporter [Streptomyces rubiginosohelvolus]|uniref:MFS transporter n=1 Tax=Streptomyces rubiginosohelvolus TaxID=67362 RepID=A0ABW6F2C2_9ACTN